MTINLDVECNVFMHLTYFIHLTLFSPLGSFARITGVVNKSSTPSTNNVLNNLPISANAKYNIQLMLR